MDSSDFLKPKEFAAYAGLGIATVYRYLNRGVLPSEQLIPGGRRMIPRDALSQARSQSKEATPPSDRTSTGLPGPQPRWKRRKPEAR